MSRFKKMAIWKCHKEVVAFKIKALSFKDGITTITPKEDFDPFEVSADYVKKHDPKVGGYYVLYGDGYESFSPAEAFEDGYTRIR